MKKSYIIVITILVFAGLLTAAEKGMAQGKECHPGMMQGRFEQKHEDGWMLEHMAEELELTDSQLESLRDLHLENKKSMIQKKAEIDILQLDKRTAMKNKDFVEAKKLTRKIFEIKQEMAMNKIDLQEEQWNLLTAEQKLKAEEMKFTGKHHPREMPEGRGKKKDM
jgi:Spy/CpxP family protein refolding chaperone